MTRTLTRLGLILAGAVAGLAVAGGPAAATPDTDCADYPSRAVAQAQFELHGGSPTYNWHGLDNDHDGQVCEHHRYPGQPTPPPNPGPGGCAVCPSPSVSEEPAPSQSPIPGGPGPGAEPSEPAPMLPITGTQNAVVGATGVAMILIGGIGIAVSRWRRRV